ncbi:MAG: radical SAM family heme chaperone HemW [Pseudomonadales bacterium]
MRDPIGLYIHIPWCIKKCPYCDFNSHEFEAESAQGLPHALAEHYVDQLLKDFQSDLHLFDLHPNISSIFIGGGTPSLIPAQSLSRLLESIDQEVQLSSDVEITLEANPNSADRARLQGYRQAGVNRLSLGIQSFNDQHLNLLGRLHDGQEAQIAVDAARRAGFENLNLDLMYGLPTQTLDDALADLDAALGLAPEHISWYQLTIEPNTLFYRRRPALPSDAAISEVSDAGIARLTEAGFERYEVSAFATQGHQSRHNRTYWQFGDYLGIGAGAHGKVSSNGRIWRTQKTRVPKDYLTEPKRQYAEVERTELPLEFLLNALRLREGFMLAQFESRTGLSSEVLEPTLTECEQLGLLTLMDTQVKPTDWGYDRLDSILERFAMRTP